MSTPLYFTITISNNLLVTVCSRYIALIEFSTKVEIYGSLQQILRTVSQVCRIGFEKATLFHMDNCM